MPPIVCIVGRSETGKTTLLEKLIRGLVGRGYRVGTIKHATKDFDIDQEGKDSWRHKQAGAHAVIISSSARIAIVKDTTGDQALDSLSSQYLQDVDIVLTEGYRREKKPKIEVIRGLIHSKPMCTYDENLVAIISDIPIDVDVPQFDLGDTTALTDFIEKEFLKGSQ
jgi:molybdopterin-guanine dinucleotide biosynthesis protein B